MKHNSIKRGLFMAVAVAGLLTGCQKENGPVTLGIETEGVGGSHNGAKVIIDNTYTPVWEGDESVIINGETKEVVLTGGQAQLQGLTEAETYRAFYPASMVSSTDISTSESISMTLPSNQTYNVDANGNQQVVLPMGAYMTDNSGTLQFKNLCSLVKLTVSNTNANATDAITVTGVELSTSNTSVNLCGTGSATVNGTATAFAVSSNGSQSITLGLGDDGVEIAGGSNHVFYFVVAPFATSSSLTFTVHADGMSDFTKTVNNKTLPRNVLAGASISISGTPVPPIAGGLFQVDAQGTMVKFATGNLRCTVNGTDTTWNFCENQYDYDVNNNGSNGTWDYFGWSTDNSNGFQYGMSQSTTCSMVSNHYKGNFVDWGEAVNNQLGSGWRTLTKDEWAYIFNTRTGATIGSAHDTCRFAFAYVNGVNSIILFPNNEDFSWPDVTIPSNINYRNGWQNASTYDITAWKKLESAGCVLLPAAGYRTGSSIVNDNQAGYYWTETPGPTNQNAYVVVLQASPVILYIGHSRSDGYSVRLVQNQTQK